MSLDPRVVHVWRIATARRASSVDDALGNLAAQEQERARLLTDPDARRRFILTRAALRSALGCYLDVPAQEVELAVSERGKPDASVAGARVPIQFSVSHAHDLSLIGFVRSARLGIDLERVRPLARTERIARRLFTDSVIATLDTVPIGQRTRAFLRAWTQREAFVKAVGGGMFQTVDPLALTWPFPNDTEVQRVPNDGSSEWSIRTFAPAPGYIATLVAEGQIQSIEWYESP